MCSSDLAEPAFAAVDRLALTAQDEPAALDDEALGRVLRAVSAALVALGEGRGAAEATVRSAYRTSRGRRRRRPAT